jgi:signal transduction histidine kinase
MAEKNLDQQMKELAEKVRQRDETERKKIEQEWRKGMEKDTAGTTFKMFQSQQAQIGNLQAQLDAAYPLGPVIRALNEIGARLITLETAVFVRQKKEGE